MPDTFQALGVLVLALLPGALFTWGYERQVGSWGIGRTDRLIRFVGGSVAFHVVAAPLTYFLYSKYWVTSIIQRGEPLPWLLWLLLVSYVLGPFIAGDWMGRSAHRGGRINKMFAGPNPAPRAWDHMFSSNPEGWVLIRLTSGRWIGGAMLSNISPSVEAERTFCERLEHFWKLISSSKVRREARDARVDTTNRARLSRAYAAAYPESQDVYLPYAVIVDPTTGAVNPDADGNPRVEARGILVKWETVEYFEVKPFYPWLYP